MKSIPIVLAALVMVGTVSLSSPARAAVGAPSGASPKETCLSQNKLFETDTSLRQKWHSLIKERPIVIGAVAAGFMAGGGLNGAYSSDPDTSLGYNWDLAARADVAVLSPLWLAGRVRYFSGNGSNLQFDALAGFNFGSYGNRWVKAGSARVGKLVEMWGSHCQLRRVGYQLLGGVKLITTTGEKGDADDVFALQAGFQKVFNNSHLIHWSILGLYDPTSSSYGAQGDYGMELFHMVYFGGSMGGLLGGKQTFWLTADVGVVFEI